MLANPYLLSSFSMPSRVTEYPDSVMNTPSLAGVSEIGPSFLQLLIGYDIEADIQELYEFIACYSIV